MRAFQAAYIGRHEFPKNLIECELRQWFTFDERERRGIRKAVRSRYWIGAALHLELLAMTGTTLGSLEYVPSVLLRHLGRQFVQKAPDLATLGSRYRHPSVGMRLSMGSPERVLSQDARDAVLPILDTVQGDAKATKRIRPDGKRLSVEHTARRIHKDNSECAQGVIK
jgi:hypothetical protein